MSKEKRKELIDRALKAYCHALRPVLKCLAWSNQPNQFKIEHAIRAAEKKQTR